MIWSIESIVHFVLLIQGFIYYSAAVPMHQSNYVKERMNEKNVRGNRAQVAWFVLIDLLFVLIAWFVSIVVANCRWWIDGQEERLLQQVERPRLHQLSINQSIHPSHPSNQSNQSTNPPIQLTTKSILSILSYPILSYLSIYLSFYLYIYLSVCLSIPSPSHPSNNKFIYLI